eukprot:600231-Hanusia_phi.AAC.4
MASIGASTCWEDRTGQDRKGHNLANKTDVKVDKKGEERRGEQRGNQRMGAKDASARQARGYNFRFIDRVDV